MIAIDVQGIGKRYRKGLIAKTIRQLLSETVRRHQDDSYFWALKDIWFTVDQGEIFGVLGRNGSGKTTLLGVLGGSIYPTEGQAIINGASSMLTVLGVGFQPDFTGHENIYLNGQLLGFSYREIAERYQKIVEFSELENGWLETPVKHYSAGMYARLAFAILSELDTPVMLIDEVLAVGDIWFQKKCQERMTKLATSGKTVLLVSQSPDLIGKLCHRAMWLEKGRIKSIGRATEVAKEYTGVTNVPGFSSVAAPTV